MSGFSVQALSLSYQYTFGPRLYFEYHPPGATAPSIYYPARIPERIAEQILNTMSLIMKGLYYTLPLIAYFCYKTKYGLTWDTIYSTSNLILSSIFLYIFALFVRLYCRLQSPSYQRLVHALQMIKDPQTEMEGRFLLRAFDFDFKWWPVDYDVTKDMKTRIHKKSTFPIKPNLSCNLCILFKLPYTIIGYIAMTSFGIHIIYPGSINILESYLRPALIHGRAKLVQDYFAKRFKLKTADNNELDIIFIDNRAIDPAGTAKGSLMTNTCVICCEGNVGFYEVGIMTAPLALQYSIIGWNHPGFGGSTGRPFPDQETKAIEAVIHFAINYLGFNENKLIIYGWSIGCYTALWAGICFPNIKGIILDAPFDDIWSIVQQQTPSPFRKLVKVAIRGNCNLNLIEMIKNYHGPIQIIRRTHDEIIATNEHIETNTGNGLVIYLLRYRYPNVFRTQQIEHIAKMLQKPLSMNLSKRTPDDDVLLTALIVGSASCDGSDKFPMAIGDDFDEGTRNKMAEFLLQCHLIDFEANHCEALSPDHFVLPWKFC